MVKKTVNVNRTRVKIDQYGDTNDAIIKYAIIKSIPVEYFYIEKINEDDIILRDITDTKFENITKDLFGSLQLMYPTLSLRDIIALILVKKPKDAINKYIKDIAILFSLRQKAIRDSIDQVEEKSIKLLEKLKEHYKKRKQSMKSLEKIKSKEYGEINLERIEIKLKIVLPLGTTLLDIFNSFETNPSIPFVHLFFRDENLFKCNTNTIPFDEWVYSQPSLDGIYTYILHKPEFKKMNVTNYSPCFWGDDNIVSFSINLKEERSKEEILDIFANSIKGVTGIKIDTELQGYIKGQYIIPSLNFNKAVFAHMIATNDLFKRFLFLDESNESVLNKTKFAFYYNIKTPFDKKSALNISITIPSSTDNWIIVRVSKAKNEDEITLFQYIFSKLIAMYEKGTVQVMELYETYGKSVKVFAETYDSVVDKKKKVDTKTSAKLAALQSKHMNIFGPKSNYSKTCSYQPIIITEREAKKMDPKRYLVFPEEGDGDDKDRDIYTCETTGKEQYIGLKKYSQVSKKSLGEFDVSTDSLLKYTPCCLQRSQHDKSSSMLWEYQHRNTPLKGIVRKNLEYILSSAKLLPSDRLGYVPVNILSMIDTELTEENVLLRQGVVRSPASFLYCLFLATSPTKYNRYTEDRLKTEIKKIINKSVREELNLTVTKQETINMSVQDMIAELKSGSYIDPKKWIRLFEDYFNVNVYLFTINKSKVDFVIPRHSIAYLKPDKVFPTKVFIAMHYINPNKRIDNVSYQCELIVEGSKKDNMPKTINKYTFVKKDSLVKSYKKHMAMAYRVKTLTIEQ